MEVGEVAREEDQDTIFTAPSSNDARLIWSLQSELMRCSVAGDWDAASALSGAIFAFAKGKGKGHKGGGKGAWIFGGKSGGKGNFVKGNLNDGGKGNSDTRAAARAPSTGTATIAGLTATGRASAVRWTRSSLHVGARAEVRRVARVCTSRVRTTCSTRRRRRRSRKVSATRGSNKNNFRLRVRGGLELLSLLFARMRWPGICRR
jgi:hypothetical protein